MADKKHPLGFTINDQCHLVGPLPNGITLLGKKHFDFEMREALTGDLLDAELEADVTKPLHFNAQLMVRQLVRIGDFQGPFTVNMLRDIRPASWRILRSAQQELDALGEAAPASAPAS